jgi:hypothetical protein
MSTGTSTTLPLTGAAIAVGGASFGIQWVAAAGVLFVVLGFAAIRYTSRARR